MGMTAKEMLEKVKAIFSGEPIPAAEPVVAPVTLSGTMYKLQDGTEISVAQAGEAIGVGDIVTIGGVPAPEGVHTLEDGTAITVDAAGVITLIVAPEPVTTDLSNEPAPPTMEQRIASLENTIKNLQAPAVPTGMATEVQLQEAAQKIEKHENTIKELFELCELLVKEPTADPKTISPNKQEQFARASKREEKLNRVADARRQIKIQS